MFNSTVANKGSETKEALGQIYETEEVSGETDRGLTISAMQQPWNADPETAEDDKDHVIVVLLTLLHS